MLDAVQSKIDLLRKYNYGVVGGVGNAVVTALHFYPGEGALGKELFYNNYTTIGKVIMYTLDEIGVRADHPPWSYERYKEKIDGMDG